MDRLSQFPSSQLSRLFSIFDCRIIFWRQGLLFDTQRRWKTRTAGSAACSHFFCTLLPSCKRYMYPWLLVCRINESLIVWNFAYNGLSFAGINTGTWPGHISEQAMVWENMHNHAQFFATTDILPYSERQKSKSSSIGCQKVTGPQSHFGCSWITSTTFPHECCLLTDHSPFWIPSIYARTPTSTMMSFALLWRPSVLKSMSLWHTFSLTHSPTHPTR